MTTAPSKQIEARAAVWDKSHGICFYCGKEMHPIREFTVDHRIPRSRGGSDHPDNLVGACWSCNFSKRAKLPANVPVAAPFAIPRPQTKSESMPRLMTAKELAEELRVSDKMIQEWVKSGVPILNIGTSARPNLRFDREKVLAWLDAGKPAKEGARR